MMRSMSVMHCRMRLQLAGEGKGRTTSTVETWFFVLVQMMYKTCRVIERLIAFITVEDTMSFSMVGGQLMRAVQNLVTQFTSIVSLSLNFFQDVRTC